MHQPTHTPSPRPTIVALRGSTRFWDQLAEANLYETAASRIVLAPGCNLKQPHPLWADPDYADRLKQMLDTLHRQKIDLADEVLIVNPGGYIGDSTRRESHTPAALASPCATPNRKAERTTRVGSTMKGPGLRHDGGQGPFCVRGALGHPSSAAEDVFHLPQSGADPADLSPTAQYSVGQRQQGKSRSALSRVSDLCKFLIRKMGVVPGFTVVVGHESSFVNPDRTTED
ncbi:hypothetical protein [Streptomyces sp. NPDC093990]|uniref:hypothetical protein n=1 Tax=Streptomyces sp. NPDC093990 TaxID=3155306 RepID=UPI00341B552D